MKTIWLALILSLAAIVVITAFAATGSLSVDLAMTLIAVLITAWLFWPFDRRKRRK